MEKNRSTQNTRNPPPKYQGNFSWSFLGGTFLGASMDSSEIWRRSQYYLIAGYFTYFLVLTSLSLSPILFYINTFLWKWNQGFPNRNYDFLANVIRFYSKIVILSLKFIKMVTKIMTSIYELPKINFQHNLDLLYAVTINHSVNHTMSKSDYT